MVKIKRVYEQPSDADGVRVLVDRLWPRGLKKESARIAAWMKDLAPSDELRRWFGHRADQWSEFKVRYLQELVQSGGMAQLQQLARRANGETITLVFAAKDETHNNAGALKEFIDTIIASQ